MAYEKSGNYCDVYASNDLVSVTISGEDGVMIAKYCKTMTTIIISFLLV